MDFSKKLKELRQKKGVTQEALAQHLDISAQAVSKWERDEGYPDITLLPRIAMYFDTSIDELLGLGEEKIRAEIEEWKKQDKKLAFNGDVDAIYDLWGEAYKKYPNNLDVIENYMYPLWNIFMKNDAKDKTLAEKVIELGKEILDRSTKTNQRDNALELMTYTYSNIGDYENAKKCAEMGGNIYSSVFHLMENALTGDEKIKYIQGMIQTLTDDLSREAKSLTWLGKNYSAEEKIEISKYALNLFLALYDKETSGFHYTRMSEFSSQIAQFYAYCKDRENALKYLADAVKFAKIFDDYMAGVESGKVYKYKSLMLNRCDDKGMTFSKNYTENECATRLRSLNNKWYDFLRDDPEFVRIKEELEANAK